MELVKRAPIYPSKCAITNLSNGEPMIDTHNHIAAPAYGDGVRIYLSRAGVEKAGKIFGLVPEAEHEDVCQKLRETSTALAEAQEELDGLREFAERVKWLESEGGFKSRQRAPRSDRGTKKPVAQTITPAEPRKESQPA